MKADRTPGGREAAPVVHLTPIVVRSYECDSYGHVNNAVYLNYLEAARHEFLKHIGFDLAAARAAGYALLVARIEIDYQRPSVADDQLVVASRATRRLRVGGVMEQRVLRGDELVAQALVTWVSVDARGRLAPLPEQLAVPGLKP